MMNSRFFSDSKVNTGRQQELDLLKALCVVGMIFVHVLLDLGKKVMPGVVDDYLTEFFGGATFMISMGIGMCYMRRQTPSSYLIRGFGLLTIGQFLNILRNCLPNLIGYWVTGQAVLHFQQPADPPGRHPDICRPFFSSDGTVQETAP